MVASGRFAYSIVDAAGLRGRGPISIAFQSTLPLHFFFLQSLFPQCHCHPAGYLGLKLLHQWFLAFFEVSDTFDIGLK